ncbi:protein DVR-1 isoform X2 [Nilaparvata lugens]|uniref:protein DVR-1 isoform X2 n=1 Tax=Nilaparvata lugens TaxID=108931 RepID=UPI00193CEF38|nr:protein DVR-1 isoform X2 [Nilaparvata lugens]
MEFIGFSIILLRMNVSQEEYDRMHKIYLKRNPTMSMHTFPVGVKILRGEGVRLEVRLVLKEAALRPVKVTLRMLVRSNGTLRLMVGRSQSVALALLAPYGPRWADIDLTPHMHQTYNQTFLLLAECQHCIHAGHQDPLLEPVLTVLSEHSRQKRSIDANTACEKDNHRKRCCRVPLEIVFKDVGFNFIIAPYKFDAGYCQGRCPPRFNVASHHALLQGLLWKIDHSLVPRPCCAPHVLQDLDFLHLDENDPSKLKVTTWTNMTVLECGCS